MDGSSESGWQRSNSSRGFNNSAVSDKKGRHRVVLDQRDLQRARASLSGACEADVAVNSVGQDWGEVSLRQWLDNPDRSVDAIECLHIFTQIVEIVSVAHSQGIVVHNVRPSCFVMSSFNHVSFIESASCSDSGSDSLEDGLNDQAEEFKGSSFSNRIRNQFRNPVNALRVVSESSSLCQMEKSGVGYKVEEIEEKKHHFPMKQVLAMETNWYTSPDEAGGASGSCASDIYRLGVLLFELFCTFSSVEEKSSTMSSLRHRVLPPQLLLKWPKEASFCLWLLHPDPSSRPKVSEIMQSEFLNEPRDGIEERESAIELSERLDEQELLLEFLSLMQHKKQEAADNLQDTVSFVSSDIEEAKKQQSLLCRKGKSLSGKARDSTSGPSSTEIIENEDSGCAGSRKRYRPVRQSRVLAESSDNVLESRSLEENTENQGIMALKSSRLMKNFKKLESAYFLTRQRAIKPPGKSSTRHSHMSSEGRGSALATERSSFNNFPLKDRFSESRQSRWINSFLEGLCKYLAFSRVKVKADLKQGDLLNSSNLVCSLDFDRDGEFFATAGVNKRIKVFEFNTVLNDDCDIHYPVVELQSRSKLSSICWNGYIKSQIASSNFEGVVQVWDATRGQVFVEMKEHERRVWSVDFSLADPTMMASGSDDGSVKLWSINQGASIATIKTKANVCCVQFPADSGRSLAFGSADHKTYYYDLRNLRTPLCTLVGHSKTVSYVKFIDSTHLVSASTDNSLKLWDLSACSSQVLDYPLQSFTGHTNVKNFVGLSVSDGYIATGSETNEVFVYHKAFPMPALSFKFGSIDPLSGADVDDSTQFISSVCFRGQSPTLIAANSMGNIKLLDMI